MEFILNIWKMIQAPVYQTIAAIIIALLSFGTAWVLAKIALAQSAIKAKNTNELVGTVMDRAATLATGIVQNLEETTGKYIREAVKDGKVDKAELQALSAQAYNELVNQLGADAMGTLQGSLTDVTAYLTNLIEAKVREAKALSTATKAMQVDLPKAEEPQ